MSELVFYVNETAHDKCRRPFGQSQYYFCFSLFVFRFSLFVFRFSIIGVLHVLTVKYLST